MKAKLAEWRNELKNDETFRQFYFFAFDYLKEHNKVILCKLFLSLFFNIMKIFLFLT